MEAAVLRGTHSREVHAVLRAPVVLLQVAQMTCHHGEIGTPFLFQPDEHAHADGVNAGEPHAVETVDAPFKVRLLAARMIDFIVLAVIGLLKANHPVHSMARQFAILLRFKRHDLYFQVGK